MILHVLPLILLVLAEKVLATPARRDFVVHESRSEVPRGFTRIGTAPTDQLLNLRIALVQNDPDGLESALMAVSDPASATYGQHLSIDEVEAFVRPAAVSVTLVNEWLQSNNLSASSISPAGDWLSFTVPVSKASEMLDAEFAVFKHSATGAQSVRTLAYSVPASLQGHIELVHPTITFTVPRVAPPIGPLPVPVTTPLAPSGSQAVPESCATAITPSCLQDLYKVPTTPATQSSNVLGISGFIDEFANKADLGQFLATFRPDIPPNTTFELQTLDGGSNPQNISEAGAEADLDTQLSMGLATNVRTVFISVGNDFHDGDLEGFLDIINFLLAENNPPHVLSTSYGQDEDTISRRLAVVLCNAFAQLGARGTSILFASGDGGVTGFQENSNCTTFVPTFPSGCPFMTSVGATTSVNPETVANFTSGGFSNFFSTPSYQTAAKEAFLKTLGTTDAGRFNLSGRGYPDISAQGGVNIEIVFKGQNRAIGGTSCASPITAAVIALINDKLITAGRPPLGFLNPFLYSVGASALNDITIGSIPGCGTPGFSAIKGWDPASGLGTPNFEALLKVVGL